MFRRSIIRKPNVEPELSKYYNATFSEGVHRQAPRMEDKAWQDRKSPVKRFWDWYAKPVYRGSVMIAYAICGVTLYYCTCLNDDAKSTYTVNTALQRTLQLESMKALEAQERLEELQKSMLAQEGKDDKDRRDLRRQQTEKSQVVNFQLELAREREKGKELFERNNNLVSELVTTRNELRDAVARTRELETEVKKLTAYTQRLLAE
jgi:hypothetical protein